VAQAGEARRSAKALFAPTIGFAGLLRSGQRKLLGADGPGILRASFEIARFGHIIGLTTHYFRLPTTLKSHIDASHKVVVLVRGGVPKLLVSEQLLVFWK
jgi:hypothetical protein